MEDEAQRGHDRDWDLGALQPGGHLPLVVAVGELAADARQNEERGHEHGTR